jgi:uncharacterized protein YbcC (UPF0753/DUF2309 family)
MLASEQNSTPDLATLRARIVATLSHLDHVLPGQAPLHDFVHHNTLHGFQHLSFEEAIESYAALTGINGYLPESTFRELYQQGRIDDHDLNAALAAMPELQCEQLISVCEHRTITRRDIYDITLRFDLSAISTSQLNWQIEELNALTTVQPDLPLAIQQQLLAAAQPNENPIRQLWDIILTRLNLPLAFLHPESLLDLSIEQAETWLQHALPNEDPRLLRSFDSSVRQHYQQQAEQALDELINALGSSITLRGFIAALSGIDILDSVRPQLIRICASALDEGIAAWQLPERSQLGFYPAWRATLKYDANPFLHELPDWLSIISELPENPIDAILLQLTHLEIPPGKWDGYLQRLALELPGWSGLINWRQQHPDYHADNDAKPQLADYLAIRLTLDRLWLNQVCRDLWRIEAKVSALQTYCRKNLSEFIVRLDHFRQNLPEYLAELAESLAIKTNPERRNQQAWQALAELVWTWRLSPMTADNAGHSVGDSGWRLFRLFQHLGLNAKQAQQLTSSDLVQILNVLNEFNLYQRGNVWLNAYEHHYRAAFFQAIQANHNRGRWINRAQRPSSQIIFCMDDREESFRRHLEELNPTIETLGAAGFFGVAMNYQGLDDADYSALCPVVVTPAHNVQEKPQAGTEPLWRKHHKGRQLLQHFLYLLYQSLRRNLWLSHPLMHGFAPFTLVNLLAKAFIPRQQQSLVSVLARLIAPDAKTKLHYSDQNRSAPATPDHPKLGFTDSEQADRIAGLLKNTGLTYGFSPIVMIMGHGSISQNNPHMAAYDCGACSGRHGGPNARVFAAMANRPEIRQLLADKDIHIPADTWFIGAEHNTCNEDIIWYDLDTLPQSHQQQFANLVDELAHTCKLSAHERCRRLASAPSNPNLEAALSHIQERAADFSQARPELGHATNAAAIIGRRALSQGVFLDRRVFLISYDPTQDPSGAILESILLAVGPVGAGINLEYYFSTVNNDRFGCGTKVPHNITGFFGVMEGASSDLRTGLPQQMVEIHEAMRLEILIEAKTTTLETIYHRQQSLRELIAGGWVHLSGIDPDSGIIYRFERGRGFVEWQAAISELPVVESSPACYRNQTLPVAPVLIKQPTLIIN